MQKKWENDQVAAIVCNSKLKADLAMTISNKTKVEEDLKACRTEAKAPKTVEDALALKDAS